MSDEKETPQPLTEEEASQIVGGSESVTWASQAKAQADEEATQNAGGS